MVRSMREAIYRDVVSSCRIFQLASYKPLGVPVGELRIFEIEIQSLYGDERLVPNGLQEVPLGLTQIRFVPF